MRKAVTYTVIAAALALFLILTPLIAAADFIPPQRPMAAQPFLNDFRGIGASPPNGSKSNADVEVLALSFALAFVAYTFSRSRRRHRDYRRIGQIPYNF